MLHILCHSHVSLHHPAGIVCSLRETPKVWKHLTSNPQHTQVIQMSVSQDVLLFLQTLQTQFHDLREAIQNVQERVAGQKKVMQTHQKTVWAKGMKYGWQQCCTPHRNSSRRGTFQSSPDTLYWRLLPLPLYQQRPEKGTAKQLSNRKQSPNWTCGLQSAASPISHFFPIILCSSHHQIVLDMMATVFAGTLKVEMFLQLPLAISRRVKKVYIADSQLLSFCDFPQGSQLDPACDMFVECSTRLAASHVLCFTCLE